MKLIGLFFLSFALVFSAKAQTRLFHDDFDQGLSQWVIEQNSDATVLNTGNGQLEIIAPQGLTLWFKQVLAGNIRISYDALVVQAGGEYDRASDLNCFWMANDPENPDDFFARSKWRNGVFGNYYSLSQYYVGYGGNDNSTTRFRKYDGNFKQFKDEKIRPEIIQEYTDSAHLITPNQWCHIDLEMKGNSVNYYFNHELLFSLDDPKPYRYGYFGFRTVKNHVFLKNFKVYQLAEKEESPSSKREMEKMDRGIVAVCPAQDSVFISWRLLDADPKDVAFNVYRQQPGGQAIQLNKHPLRQGTYFIDTEADLSKANKWFVTPANEAKPECSPENSFTLNPDAVGKTYLSIPLQIPPSDKVGDQEYSYSANDASVADLDGDGKYEIILKWQPSLVRNPPQKGLTGLQLIDAYKLDGTLLWRINLGKNIRSGAAYTQFLVYDLDGDGRAEMACKTADGTVDGAGNVVGDAGKDWRTLDPDSPTFGKIIDGPEYLTVFDGLTGQALATENYIPDRYPLDGWGGVGGNGNNDDNGGRSDRFSAAVAYLDGIHPSALFVRGWYGRTAVAAWDFRDGKLSLRWLFDSKDADNPYSGQANHQVSVADVDQDGKDELCVGAMTVDDDGQGLYTTGLRHGDALSISDMDPDRPGLEVYGIHENEGKTLALQTPGVAMFDAKTGEILFSIGPGVDVGRGLSADIDPTHRGFENWGGPGGLRDVHGKTISERTPSSTNFVLWWDGDLSRELLDKNRIDKWDWRANRTVNLMTAKDCVSNNGTKATPCLSADLLGDWREEVIWRTADNSELRIYTTTIPTAYRFRTVMQDPQYRLSIAWQNVAYNQPPFNSFYLGTDMNTNETSTDE